MVKTPSEVLYNYIGNSKNPFRNTFNYIGIW
jgi:hypothetical protein